MPTLWFTFSAADNHWLDLHHIDLHPIDSSLDEKEQAIARRKFIRMNPHIVDKIFYERVKILIKKWFGKNGLEAEYVWFRIEYQERGTAHVHGCMRLKSDPGLIQLAVQV